MFPAPAGMNRYSLEIGTSGDRVPRARGDEPNSAGGTSLSIAVFPAPAGMNRNHSP